MTPICRIHAARLFLSLLVHPVASGPTMRALDAMKGCSACQAAR